MTLRTENTRNVNNASKNTAHRNAAHHPSTGTNSRKDRLSIGTLLTLIICFPAGLFAMWKNPRCPLFAKSAVTLAVSALLIAVLLPLTDPPERQTGGIYLVDETPCVEVQGPEAPADRQVIEIYAPRYTSIILEATATPEPIIVYCNNSGKYYHVETCKYVNEKTPDVTLTRAIEAGFTQCPECDAPSPY